MGDWIANAIGGAAATLWSMVTETAFMLIPTWVWVIVVILAAAWVWRQFGWQGLVALGLAVLTFGAYRQGWRDARAGVKPRLGVPVGDEPQWPDVTPKPPKRKRKRILVNGYWKEDPDG